MLNVYIVIFFLPVLVILVNQDKLNEKEKCSFANQLGEKVFKYFSYILQQNCYYGFSFSFELWIFI